MSWSDTRYPIRLPPASRAPLGLPRWIFIVALGVSDDPYPPHAFVLISGRCTGQYAANHDCRNACKMPVSHEGADQYGVVG